MASCDDWCNFVLNRNFQWTTVTVLCYCSLLLGRRVEAVFERREGEGGSVLARGRVQQHGGETYRIRGSVEGTRSNTSCEKGRVEKRQHVGTIIIRNQNEHNSHLACTFETLN